MGTQYLLVASPVAEGHDHLPILVMPVACILEMYDLFQALEIAVVKKPFLEVGAGASVVGHCGQENRTPLNSRERSSREAPRRGLEIVTGSGHLVPIDEPDQLASAIAQFVTQL